MEIVKLSHKDEFDACVNQGTPAIVTGFDSPAFHIYTLDLLEKMYGDFPVPTNQHASSEFHTIKELRAKLRSSDKPVFAAQIPLFNYVNMQADKSEEMQRRVMSCAPPNWLQNFNEANIWLGRGTTPLHYDGYDNLLAVTEGEKHVFLFPPDAVKKARCTHQWALLDAKRLIDVYPSHYEFIVRAGEMLYLPPYWLHEVSVPTLSAVSINYWYHQQCGTKSEETILATHSLQLFTECLAALNEVQRAHTVLVLEDIVAQFKEGCYPLKTFSWSQSLETDVFGNTISQRTKFRLPMI
jgi:hypothetical protein